MNRKRLTPADPDAARAATDYRMVRAKFSGRLSEAQSVLKRAELRRIVAIVDELAKLDTLPANPPFKVTLPYVRRDGTHKAATPKRWG